MPRHLESAEQRLFVARFRMDPRTRDWPACAIPNGGRRGKVEAAIIKAEGVSAGAPDWVCFKRPRGVCGLALEFKSPNGKGRVTEAQLWWHLALYNEGWRVAVVRSADEAWTILCETYGLIP